MLTLRFLDKIRGLSSASSVKCLFSPKLMSDDDEEQNRHQVVLNKLTMENLELKGVIENQKKGFNDKLSKLQEMLGLEIAIDKIVNSAPNSNEFKTIKKLRETKERAENLSKENLEMESRLSRAQSLVEQEHKDLQKAKEKHSEQLKLLHK